MADTDSGESALHYAAACGFGEKGCRILALLLDHGASVNQTRNQDGWTPLHSAVRAHNEEMFWDIQSDSDSSFPTLTLLVQWGASLEAVDSFDKTPLDVARHPLVRLHMESLQREHSGTGEIYKQSHSSDN